MNKFFLIAIMGALVWHMSQRDQQQQKPDQTYEEEAYVGARLLAQWLSRFHCDGRTHCSRMTSCAEATFFIRNCSYTQMDGDNEGVPLEVVTVGRLGRPTASLAFREHLV